MRSWLTLSLIFAFLTAGCGRHLDLLAPPDSYDPSLSHLLRGVLHEGAQRHVDVEQISIGIPPLPRPRTPADFDRSVSCDLSLPRSLAMALQNSEVVRTIAGPGLTVPQTTVYDPAAAETQVQAALAAFDTSAAVSMLWERRETPPFVSFQGLLDQPQRLDLAGFRSSLIKPFSTGLQPDGACCRPSTT